SRRSPLTYNQLVRFEPDMTPVPELAESWQVSPDGLTWTFKLRQGVKFHDGQEFTSADVKFTFDRLLQKSASGKSDFGAADKLNPSYWKKGLPHADELIVRVIPDEANIVAALRTGQIHHAFIEDNKNFNLLKDEKSLTGYRSSRLGYDYLNMSANRGHLKDVR